MGSLQSTHSNFIIQSHQWKQMSTTRKLLVNSTNQKIASYCQFQQMNKSALQIYAFRAENQEFLVGFYGVICNKQNNSSCFMSNILTEKIGKLSNVKVLIPNIQYRISDLGALSLEQGMYVIWQCINGLKIITQKYGYVFQNLQQEYIGVSQDGQCKIWINENYFQGLSQHSNNKLNESKLVGKVFEMIESRMHCSLKLEQKKQYFILKSIFQNQGKKDQLSFYSSLKFIQQICDLNKINLKKIRLQVPTIENPQKSQLQQFSMFKVHQKSELSEQKLKKKISLKNKSSQQLYKSHKSSQQKPIPSHKILKTSFTENKKDTTIENLLQRNSRITKLSQQTLQSENQIKNKFSIKYKTYKRAPSYIYYKN